MSQGSTVRQTETRYHPPAYQTTGFVAIFKGHVVFQKDATAGGTSQENAEQATSWKLPKIICLIVQK